MKALLLALLAAATLQAQPRPHTFTLPNGLRVVHLEDRERPLVRVSLLLRVLPSDTPPGRPGLALLAGRMLTGPGGPRTEAVDRDLEAAGIRLDTASAPEGLTWKLAARNREQDRAMGLLAELVLRPVLNPQHLAACRADCMKDLFQRGASPGDRLREALAWDPAERPTEATLLAIGPEDLATFQQRVFRPERATLILHGDLGIEQAKRLVLLNFGSWPAGPTTPVTPPAAPPKMLQAQPVLIPRLGPALRIQALAPVPGDLRPEAAALLSLLVPGNPLLAPLRATWEGAGLTLTLDTTAPGAREAWALFFGRLAALAQRGFTPADLDRARRIWGASLSLDTLNPEAQMARAQAALEGRLPTQEALGALTLQDLNADLRRWLTADRLRVGAIGPAGTLEALPTR